MERRHARGKPKRVAASRPSADAVSGVGAERTRSGLAWRSRLFEFDEERYGLGGADVLSPMLLRIEPAHLTGEKRDIDVPVLVVQPAVEAGGRDHHTVWMLVGLCPVARAVVVAQNPNSVVLEGYGVELGIGCYGVCHGSSKSVIEQLE